MCKKRVLDLYFSNLPENIFCVLLNVKLHKTAKKKAKGSNDTATMKRRAEVLALIEESRQYDSTGACVCAVCVGLVDVWVVCVSCW